MPDRILGDINADGAINGKDSNALKQMISGAMMPTDIEQKAADVNKKDGVEKYDYILIKRHVMGTFKIEG